MRIKILKSCSGLDFSYKSGNEVDVSSKLGKDLVSGGLAEEIKAEVKTKDKAGGKANAKT